MTKTAEVKFQPKSSWQRTWCLFCHNEAVLEAVLGCSFIRCCENEKCKEKAKKFAKIGNKSFGK